MLSGFLTLSVLVGYLHALLIPASLAIILPSELGTSSSRLNASSTERKDWPSTPFIIPYYHNLYALKITTYGGEPHDLVRLSIQVSTGLDYIIHDVLRSRREEFSPSIPPLWINQGIVHLHICFLTTVSSIKIALGLQVLRDLMVIEYWPRDILTAEFGLREPWGPMVRFSLKLLTRPIDGHLEALDKD